MLLVKADSLLIMQSCLTTWLATYSHYQKQLSDNREAASARLNTIANISFDTPIIQTDDDNFGMTLGVSKSFGQLNANAGVTHSQGDDDKSTNLFVGVSSTF